MQKPLVFMMGRSPATLPVDRFYTKSRLWAASADGGLRFGFSAYAVRLLGDVKHLEWSVDVGAMLEKGQPIGYIEALKATSDLFVPMAGSVQELNPAVLADPSLVNSSLYDDAWLFRILGSGEPWLTPEQYLGHLEASWPLRSDC